MGPSYTEKRNVVLKIWICLGTASFRQQPQDIIGVSLATPYQAVRMNTLL